MKKDKILEYVDFFNKKDDVFVCFRTKIEKKDKSEVVVDDRFHVYAYGGRVCELPIESEKENGSKLKLFNENYLDCFNKGDEKENFKRAYSNAKNGDNDTKFSFIENKWDEIMIMMKNRAEGYNNGKIYIERQRENIIARNNNLKGCDFIVCDMEFAVSGNKIAKADMVAVNIEPNNGNDEVNIAFIEYKCTKSALTKNSLIQHYNDMKEYTDENAELYNITQETVIRRYNKMVEYGLINSPKIDFSNSNKNSKIVFLFTHEKDMGNLKNRYNELIKKCKDDIDKENVLFIKVDNENDVCFKKEFFKKELSFREDISHR